MVSDRNAVQSGLSTVLKFLTCHGTEGAKGRPDRDEFLQQHLNQSKGQTMQTTSKKNEKKIQNRTTNGTFGGIPLREEIEARAHQIYLARGAEPGNELDDWLQAEREIMEWV
jgi:hypothetical protein